MLTEVWNFPLEQTSSLADTSILFILKNKDHPFPLIKNIHAKLNSRDDLFVKNMYEIFRSWIDFQILIDFFPIFRFFTDFIQFLFKHDIFRVVYPSLQLTLSDVSLMLLSLLQFLHLK